MNGKAIDERFWSNVWRCAHRWPCPVCCWPWEGKTHRFGVPEWQESFIPYRFAWMIEHHAMLLPFARPLALCHTCDYSPCCNAAHLFPGTQGDNIHDARNKGYFVRQRQRQVHLPDGTTFALETMPPAIARAFHKERGLRRQLGLTDDPTPAPRRRREVAP